ncbi:MAG: RNA chaperone Hfq [Candidatus Methanoperedens sp.]|nr:RNA chaperone Hfq [Candidatus Methanoperedens sp.]
MVGEQKNKDELSQKSYLSDFLNKVIICETLSGKTITGILTGFDRYELILVETKDIKSKKPMKIVVYKHALVSIREME